MKKITLTIICLLIIMLIPTIILAAEDVVEVSTEEALRTALENGKSIKLTKNIELSEITKNECAKKDNRPAAIAINGEGNVTIYGNGHTISTSKVRTLFEIYSTGNGINVTFENIILDNYYQGGRCIDTRTENIILNINDSNLTTYTGSYDQTITIGGNDVHKNTISVNINNSKVISHSHYAIIALNPVKLKIDNCELIEGFAALYMKKNSLGSLISVNNSKLIGTNKGSAASGSFGTVTFEDNGINLDVKNSTVIAKQEGTAYQFVIEDRKGNTVTVYNSKIEADTVSLHFVEGTKIILNNQTVIVDPSIENIDIFKEFIPTDAVCKKSGDNEYTVFEPYAIQIGEVTGGVVKLDKEKAFSGEIVKVTAQPDEGYELGDIMMLEASDKQVAIENGEFIMPNMGVVVNVKFNKKVIPETSKQDVTQDIELSKEIDETEELKENLLGSLNELAKENQELADFIKNNNVEVKVDFNNLDKSEVEPEEKEKIEKVITKEVEGIKIGKYFDIKILVKNADNDEVLVNIPKLNKDIIFTVAIPEDLPKLEEGYTRNYYIIRNHNGEIEIIKDAKLSEDGKSIIFGSDKFSTYAIAYTDVEDKVVEGKVDKELIISKKSDEISKPIAKASIGPVTGDDIAIYVVSLILSIFGIVILGKLNKSKSRH